jgi:unsaturated rhamnogalacturonyl hydrolase
MSGAGRLDAVLLALLAMQRDSWEQGVAAQAMLDLGRQDLAGLMAHAAVTRQTADGRLAGAFGGGDDNAVNGAACGEAVLAAGLREAADRQLAWLLRGAPRGADGVLFHVLGGTEAWADTVYMVAPFLALTGHTDEAVRQIDGHRERLCRDGLYGAVEGRRPEHWGGGNGWVVAGIARAIRLAPRLRDSHLPGHAAEVLDACLALARPDGLFHDVLDDPASFRETNAAQMFAYAAFTGVADGWLPPPYAHRARELLAAAGREIGDDGLVRGACGSPSFDRPGTSAEAQAFHLMAAAAEGRCHR